MKKFYLLSLLTVILLAAPMSEEKALALFDAIKQSEYDWVIQQWNQEMPIKEQSRSSSRQSVWEIDYNSQDIRSNEALRTTKDIENESPAITNTPSTNEATDTTAPETPTNDIDGTDTTTPKDPVTVPSVE